MIAIRHVRSHFLAGTAILMVLSISMPARTSSLAEKKGSQEVSAQRDGQHDFDFNFGTWKTHIKRLQHPLTGSSTWVTLDGTVVVRKVWDGRAQLEEVEADGPASHHESLSLFLYHPQSHQWTIHFAGSTDGALSPPATGEFRNGRGEFYDQEPYNGRAILVRIIWSDISADSHRFEQSFSDDGGKTWEPNFVATLTRVKE
jgi:hypothetical protein